MTTNTEIGETTMTGRRTRASEMPPNALAVRWGVGTLGWFLTLILLIRRPPDEMGAILFFTVAAAVAEVFLLVRVRPGSYFSISPAFVLGAFYLGGVGAAALVDGLSRVVAGSVRFTRKRWSQTPLFTLYNSGQVAFASVMAGLLANALFPPFRADYPGAERPIAGLLVFAIVHFLVVAGTSSLAVYAQGGSDEVRLQLWPTTTRWGGISMGTCLPFALVMVLIARGAGYRVALFLITLLLAGLALVVRLNVDLRKGNQDLKAINQIGGLINATLDLAELFRILSRESRRVLPWDGFFIAIGKKDSQEIQLVFMTGGGNQMTQRVIPQGSGLTGRAIQNGELIHYEREENGPIDESDTLKGQRRPRSIVVAPMKFEGEVIGAISIQSFQADVYGASQLRLLQTIAGQAATAVRNAQLFLSEEKAKTERDEFLSLVTHEIKNPLTSVRGYADLAELSVKAGDVDGAVDSIGVIRTEAGKILRLAEDLLEASKMSAGRFSIRMEESDFAGLVTTVVDRYMPTSQQKIVLDVPDRLPNVDCDPVRMSQVIENLVSNAVKYSSPSARIDVGIRAVADRILLTVADQGHGIAAEKLPLIFDRFYRVEQHGGVVKGTGLGLFITREIVRMHGGEIKVESTLGEGSRFVVELPIRHTRQV